MKRRTVMTAGGSAVMATIAGCIEDSDNGPIEENAADLLLSADEISEAAPGEWQTENLGVVEGIEATGISGVESADGVELAGEENNEIVFVVHVSETIEDAKEFFTDRDDEAEDDIQVEQDVGEEAFALFLSDEVRSLTTRERNILIYIIATLPIRRHRELAELQIERLL